MKHFIRLLLISVIPFGIPSLVWAQEKPATTRQQELAPEEEQEKPVTAEPSKTAAALRPAVLPLSEDGSKYIRFLFWHQHWIQTNNLAAEGGRLQLNHGIRRSRVMAYAQVSPRFLILTHFGLNNLTAENISSLGNDGDAAQFFLHEAWAEFKISNDEALYLGAGLHYWRGLTRFASHGTTGFMTLDQPRPFVHWHSSAVTDQFNRHLGVYAKGQVGQFDYRLAINNPGRNGLQENYGLRDIGRTYSGFQQPDKDGNPTGNTILEGYFRYNLWDKEDITLPNMTGTYLGAKKAFALGAGFFAHPNGIYNSTTQRHENVSHFAVDAYLDLPLSEGDCLNAYAAYLNFNYGKGFVSRWAGTGTAFYGQVGYKPPGSRFMPYVAIQHADYEGFDKNIQAYDFGLNYFIQGHHAKITLEYHSVWNDPREGGLDPITGTPTNLEVIRLQAQVFL